MLQSTLDDLSLENKIGIDKLLKDEEIITIINSQVSEIITEMQDIVKKDHTIMNNTEKMYILGSISSFLILNSGKDCKGWRSQFRSVAKE